MAERGWLTDHFEQERPRLRGVAYRMLGSVVEAEDALQEAWLRLSRADTSSVENLSGWLTTVVARVCLNLLQARKARHEEPLGMRMPDPIVSLAAGGDPEHEALLGDSVGLALQLVLEALSPAERVAFVLHDVFAVPFDEIAPIVGRTPAAARQLASRARRRVQQGEGARAMPDTDLAGQRTVVQAFLAAAREGNFEALLAALDPDVMLRADRSAVPAGAPTVIRGARAVAAEALTFARLVGSAQPAVVNGAVGLVSWGPDGRPFSVLGFTVRRGKIVEIDVLADRERLHQLGLAAQLSSATEVPEDQ